MPTLLVSVHLVASVAQLAWHVSSAPLPAAQTSGPAGWLALHLFGAEQLVRRYPVRAPEQRVQGVAMCNAKE